MAYIYKITNKINGKIYIGKTMKTPEERWKEHCQDSKKERAEKRPLYSAMNKYGIKNFSLEVVEKCSDDIVNDREVYWIEYYQSFKYGYNATLGGDGKHYLDYDLIYSIYEQTKNCTEVARQLNICVDSVRKVLKNREIQIKPGSVVTKEKFGKIIHMYSIQDEYLKTFSSIREAAIFICEEQNKSGDIKGISVHIRQAAQGKRKTAYKYKWKF